jgi:hypothetical protein
MGKAHIGGIGLGMVIGVVERMAPVDYKLFYLSVLPEEL